MQTHDIAPLIEEQLNKSTKAFRRFRKGLNGDGSIEYQLDMENEVLIFPHTFEEMMKMMEVIFDDNLERPFFVIFDEEQRTALDIVFGEPGNEGHCNHTEELVLKAREVQETQQKENPGKRILLSRGHTHPVFYDEPIQKGMGSILRLSKIREFGALPSNIYGNLKTWQLRKEEPECSELRKHCIDEVIRNRLYKRKCEDYLESYYSSFYTGFNSPITEKGSQFHWIITPRLGQIGVFEVVEQKFGVVVYHPWKVVEFIT